MNGQSFGDYIKVRALDDSELEAVAEREKAYLPKTLNEPELPIDMGEPTVEETEEKVHWPSPKERPTPTQYVVLLAIYRNPGKKQAELVKIIRKGGMVRNKRTIYGSDDRLGIFQTLVKLKLAEQNKGKFSLTEKGRRWVEPSKILEPDKDRIGSDMHERILIRTIEELQKKHMLVVVPESGSESELTDCIDLIAYPIDEKRKYLWDDDKRKGYEIQTAATKERITGHAELAERYGVPLTWVSWDTEVLEAIKRLRGEKDDYMVVKI